MLNFITKSALFCIVPKLINDAYPTVKKTVSDSIDSVGEFYDSLFEDEKETKKAIPIQKITVAQYQIILEAHRKNTELPSHTRLTQSELTVVLNRELGLNRSRSSYRTIWAGTFNTNLLIYPNDT